MEFLILALLTITTNSIPIWKTTLNLSCKNKNICILFLFHFIAYIEKTSKSRIVYKLILMYIVYKLFVCWVCPSLMVDQQVFESIFIGFLDNELDLIHPINHKGSRKKSSSLNGWAIKALTPPPSGIMAIDFF